MRTLQGSRLAIGFYPTFSYDSSGGGGVATARSSSTPGRINVEFDPSSVFIPDVTGQSSRWPCTAEPELSASRRESETLNLGLMDFAFEVREGWEGTDLDR